MSYAGPRAFHTYNYDDLLPPPQLLWPVSAVPLSSNRPPILHLPPSRAAREVYLCPELRQHILSLLDKHTLTRFIRVEKQCVFDVAKELYKTMSYIWVRSHKLKIAPAMLKKLNIVVTDTDPKERNALTAQYLAEYHTEVFNLVVPPMRKKCRGLRRMLFGKAYAPFGADFWIVHFEAASEGELEGRRRPKAETTDGGSRIDYRQTVRWHLREDPPAMIDTPPPPSDQYTMRRRFDLMCEGHGWTSDHTSVDKWLAAFREDTILSSLYKAANLYTLPINLDDLTNIYRRQAALGYAARLGHITAPGLSGWSIPDFRTFATAASTSLTFLSIPNSSRHAQVTLHDLPTLIEIIQTTLPNLSTLHFSILGVEEAETICKAFLSEQILRDHGSLRTLNIYTSTEVESSARPLKDVELFNLIRVVSRLCRPLPSIRIIGSEWDHFSRKHHTDYIRFLWRQTPEARAHLATIDFSSLGITRLTEVLQLGFETDGRPMSLWGQRIRKLDLVRRTEQVRTPPRLASSRVMLELQHSVMAARRVEGKAKRATTAEMLRPVNKLRKALKRAGTAVRVSSDLPGHFALLKDVRELYRGMKAQLRPPDWEVDDSDSDLGISSESDSEPDSW